MGKIKEYINEELFDNVNAKITYERFVKLIQELKKESQEEYNEARGKNVEMQWFHNGEINALEFVVELLRHLEV